MDISPADEYASKNEALLDSLPDFPGAERFSLRTMPYYQEEGGPLAGYVTQALYRLPSDTPRSRVADFYEERLASDWELYERIRGADGPVLNFRRDASLVSVNLHQLATLDISVDVDSYFLRSAP